MKYLTVYLEDGTLNTWDIFSQATEFKVLNLLDYTVSYHQACFPQVSSSFLRDDRITDLQ